MRLADGTESEGRLEIWRNGQWGTCLRRPVRQKGRHCRLPPVGPLPPAKKVGSTGRTAAAPSGSTTCAAPERRPAWTSAGILRNTIAPTTKTWRCAAADSSPTARRAICGWSADRRPTRAGLRSCTTTIGEPSATMSSTPGTPMSPAASSATPRPAGSSGLSDTPSAPAPGPSCSTTCAAPERRPAWTSARTPRPTIATHIEDVGVGLRRHPNPDPTPTPTIDLATTNAVVDRTSGTHLRFNWDPPRRRRHPQPHLRRLHRGGHRRLRTPAARQYARPYHRQGDDRWHFHLFGDPNGGRRRPDPGNHLPDVRPGPGVGTSSRPPSVSRAPPAAAEASKTRKSRRRKFAGSGGQAIWSRSLDPRLRTQWPASPHGCAN